MIAQSELQRRVPPRTPPSFNDDETDDKFHFVGNPKQPKTLIALRYQHQISGLEIPLKVIWVCRNQDQLDCKSKISQYSAPIIVQNFAELKTEKKNYPTEIPIQIWFSNQQDYTKLQDMDWAGYQLEKVYFNPDNPNAKKEFKEKRRNKEWEDVAYGTNCFKDLMNTYFQKTALPNFRCLGKYDKIQDLQKMTLIAILNDQNEQLFGLQSFLNIVKEKWDCNKSQIATFHSQLDQLQTKKTPFLELYTKPTFFYMFLNHFMKLCKNPMQIYYIKAVIKRLYRQVKQLYSKQKKNQKGEQIFYRGALFQPSEIEELGKNIGKIVRSFGFMSTSKNKQTAESFVKNALITIFVMDAERDEEKDHGFADIKQFSHFFGQQEWLFNPNNQFRIQKVEPRPDGSGKWDIHLVYGVVAEVGAKSFQTLSKSQKIIDSVAVYDRQLGQVSSQGEIFMKCNYYNTFIVYCNKKLTFIEGKAPEAEVVKIKKQLIEAYLKKQQYKKALQRIKQINSDQPSLLKLEGDVHFGLKEYAQAEQCYRKSLSNSKILSAEDPFFINLPMNFDNKIPKIEDNLMICTLLSLSQTCLKLDNVPQAKKFSRIAIADLSKISDIRCQNYAVQLLKHSMQFESVNDNVKQMIKRFLAQIQEGEDKTAAAYIGCLLLVVILFVGEKQTREIKSGDCYKLIEHCESLYSETEKFFSPTQNGDFYFFKAIYFYFVGNDDYALQALNSALKYNQNGVDKHQQALTYRWIGEIKSKKEATVHEAKHALKKSLSLEKQQANQEAANLSNIIQCFNKLISLRTEVDANQLEGILQFFIAKTGRVIELNELYLDIAKLHIESKKYSAAQSLVFKFQQNNSSFFSKLFHVQISLLIATKKYKEAYLKARHILNKVQQTQELQRAFSQARELYCSQLLNQVQNCPNNQILQCLSQLSQKDLEELFCQDEQSYTILRNKKIQQEKLMEQDDEEDQICRQILRSSRI